MITRARIQILTICAVAVAAWLLGYFMGTSGQNSTSSQPSDGKGSSVPRPGPAALAAGREHRTVAQEENGSLRRQAWTRERLLSPGADCSERATS